MIDVFYYFRLYVLELQEHKWFLHFASPSNDEYLWIECASQFPFVNKYLPVKTVEVIKIDSILDIDFYVKKYMYCYGIENVRGGSYSDEILNNNAKTFLNNEINADGSNYFKNQIMMDNIYKKYVGFTQFCVENAQMATLPSLIYSHEVGILNEKMCKREEDFTKEMRYLQEELIKCREVKKKIKYIGPINRSILDDLDWLVYYIVCVVTNEENKKISPQDSVKYRKIIEKLKTAKNVFTNVLEQPIKYDDNIVFLKNPEFILDDFFYHSHIENVKQRCAKNMEAVEKQIRYFEYMCYFIINRLEEFEFDLSTYNEECILVSINYLNNVIELKN